MKIAIILRKIKLKDGIQAEAFSLGMELKRMGHEITMYTYDFDPALALPDLVKEFKIISLEPGEKEKEEKIFGIFSRPSYLVKWNKRNREARRLAHKIHRDTDLLNPHSSMTYPVSAYFKKEIRDIPAVWLASSLPLHRWRFRVIKIINPLRPIPSFLKRLFYYFMDEVEIWKFIRHHRIVALSETNRKNIIDLIRQDADVVYAGTDISKFPYKERAPLVGRRIRVLLTGTLFAYRRFEDTIDAVRLLIDKGYDARITIIGAYTHALSYHEQLRKRVENHGIAGNVSFLGFVKEGDLTRIYQEHDVTVSSVSTQEAGIGLTILDAMACGIPVIISRAAAACEVLADGVTALFVDPKSPSEIAHAVETISQNPELYVSLCRNGRKLVEEKFTWTHYAKSLLCMFEDEYNRYKKI